MGRVVPAEPAGWVPQDGDPSDTAAVGDAEAEPVASTSPDRPPPPAPGVGELLRAAVAEKLPPTLRGARVSPAGRGWRALAVVAALAAAVSVGLWWHARSVPTVVPTPARAIATPSASASHRSAPAKIVVDVSGKVRDPGIVRLPAGSRVQDAIRAAGGLKHGARAGSLNLARELVDGEQIVVGGPGAASPPVAGGSPSAAPIDLNTATIDQLETLPGVGPVLGQRIIDYRTAHGGFTAVEQLQDISGIGEKTYADLKPHVRI